MLISIGGNSMKRVKKKKMMKEYLKGYITKEYKWVNENLRLSILEVDKFKATFGDMAPDEMFQFILEHYEEVSEWAFHHNGDSIIYAKESTNWIEYNGIS